MTKYLALLFLLASPVLAAHLIYDERAPINQRAIDEIVKNEKARDTKTYSDWTVVKGTESYTLKEFVESGRLCEWRGRHSWSVAGSNYLSPCGGWSSGGDASFWSAGEICAVCRRCRRKVGVREELEWEP